ncbi:solute carrier family 51 subunit beta [Acanthochromis polyacanthus]|uniref:solute carrier family 51 subunit beta n=1 Tax=Acanthochromis polyacanthus TaxID=80966 RepID=UPI0022343020|nr:solute carrier family 51 subunit beta [Acanthochromis polyacanthus]XP_051793691.1 solute carrier family 51 subunit beta [Acanthochromis polyacanthus]
MSEAWALLFLLLSGGKAFMIHNTQHCLCLEDSVDTGEVLLRKCNLDSKSQQWNWIDQGMLMCVASFRCLSAQQGKLVRTQSCHELEVDVKGHMWDCDRGRLINRNTSMLLSVSGQHLILTQGSEQSKWKSLDEGDICQERLRLRRAADDVEEFDPAEEQAEDEPAMTEEQREYLRWFYRTEDPTIWKFVLLGLAFVCLLIGFLLLGMGAMANKSRKKIAKYKAAASLAQKSDGEELQVISSLTDNSASPRSDRRLQPNQSPMSNRDAKSGDIVVTWKDGNTSCLYSNTEEEEQEEEVKEEQEEVLAAELDAIKSSDLSL